MLSKYNEEYLRALTNLMADNCHAALHGGIDYDYERELIESGINRLCLILGVSSVADRNIILKEEK